MRRQFLKEWDKFIHAWSVRIVFLLFLAGGIIAAVVSDCTGYMAPFMGCSYWGIMGPMLFAVIVAGQVVQSFRIFLASCLPASLMISSTVRSRIPTVTWKK